MDPAKIKLLFDRVPTWAHPDDPGDRSELLSEELGNDLEGQGAIRPAMYETIANQIADEDPPEVWKTAQRLLGAGLDRHRVLQNLALALKSCVQTMLLEERPFDADSYAAVLKRLPLPAESEARNGDGGDRARAPADRHRGAGVARNGATRPA